MNSLHSLLGVKIFSLSYNARNDEKMEKKNKNGKHLEFTNAVCDVRQETINNVQYSSRMKKN